jgi:hypothetical protein
MFDSTAKAAAELLSYFGKNTAVRIDHKYGHNTMHVVVARTGNVLATIDLSYSNKTMLHHWAAEIMAMKKFPRPRNMRRSWSPIRLPEAAKVEADIRRATMNGYFIA